MNIEVDIELAWRLLLSFAIGSAIGIEREYRSKAAGLRTMIVICLGSTIFTEISLNMGGDSTDRVAANIITGIGFLGAGVIFKDGLTISGITTATTIWISAALGMAVGAGEYFIALVGSGMVLIVLTFFEKFKLLIIQLHQSRTYKITFRDGTRFATELDDQIRKLKLECRQERDMKDGESTILVYEVSGREKYLDELNGFLKNDARVRSYEY
jgi:putative Mg2+ transporter-C (MgtC) family protein